MSLSCIVVNFSFLTSFRLATAATQAIITAEERRFISWLCPVNSCSLPVKSINNEPTESKWISQTKKVSRPGSSTLKGSTESSIPSSMSWILSICKLGA
ncbi:hypothetical protein DFS33DRAFT_8341 [Desarmillaria ectypa]|nr:hypothetical protein DFS33DRAFT_8341 [Desarmillaria ectypa]